jgi:signal transduction histidine kinase/ligand-binding sensor domain-containing protein/DNA-binding response OmpR family regulator
MNKSFFLIILFALPFQIWSQKTSLSFHHFGEDQGMSSSDVGAIYQDRAGYIWFGTVNGVDRFDGYNFTTFRYPDDSIIIKNDFSGTIAEDNEGNLWIGNYAGGLEKLNPQTKELKHYLPDPGKPENDWCNIVMEVCIDRNEEIWIGTGGGFYKFNKENDTFTSFRHNEDDPFSLGHNSIDAIYEDKQGTLWLGTGGGLDRYDRKENKFYHYWHYPNNIWGENGVHWIHTIIEDNSGFLWLGTDNGLLRFDRKDESFLWYASDPPVQGIKDVIMSLCEDDANNIWFASMGGLGVFNKTLKSFSYYEHDEENPASISWNKLVDLFIDRSGSLWISGWRGVDRLDYVNQPFTSYIPSGKGELAYFWMYEIIEKGILMSTNKGLLLYDTEEETFTKIINKLIDSEVWQDKLKNLWFCSDGALYKLDMKNQMTCYYETLQYNNQISSVCISSGTDNLWIGNRSGDIFLINPYTGERKWITQLTRFPVLIYEDSFGLVWFGGEFTGLFCYNPSIDSVSKVSTEGSDNTFWSYFEDKNKVLWIGSDKGLYKYDRIKKTLKHFTESDGFWGEYAGKILEDDHGNLWISTKKGIVKLDCETSQFTNYFSYCNNIDIRFLVAGCKTKKGEMYFGGINGYIRFHPDSLKNDHIIPPIVITSFKKFEEPASFEKKIELPYTENFISFEFAALSYINSEDNQYAYMMEGLDKDWIFSGSRRYASYPNMDPGEYVFHVKGSTSDMVWNETGISLIIIISPPWWKTIWAYTFYILLVISVIYFIWKMQLKRIRIMHEFEMSRLEAEKLHEVDQMKSRFFANISHEFRTPLTLIMGPVNDIINKSKDNEIKYNAGLIKKNASSLSLLVNQLLDLSKLEAGRMTLETKELDIIPLLKGLVLSFSSLAERKRILLRFNTSEEKIILYYDKDKIEKIINNILSNAFKFTPDGGTIDFSIRKNLKETEIKISDTGPGIPASEIDKIFNRFYQVDGSHTREKEGTGIGLALTKELVELHKGKIMVESIEGSGTSFTICLLNGKEHLKPEEILSEQKYEELQREPYLTYETEQKKERTDIEFLFETDKPLLLIVEDNPDVRRYIIHHLETEYRTLEAVNGEEGLIQATNHIPDLIISDLMMPKMDGTELCRKLKNDNKTSHIPVVLLTAKAASGDKICGYNIGADDYIIKPFDALELKARIKNLIETRRKLQEKFRSGDFIIPKELNPIDEEFLNRLFQVINRHISEEEFSIEDLGKESGMSRGQVYKKIKALTGRSPSLFLRSVRLSRARKMIKEGGGTIAEIAFLVGFSSPAYFTKCFNEEYGYLPSDILKK